MSDPTFDPKAVIPGLPQSPGVYRMLDGAGHLLYVGKAKDIKKRVASYFTRGQTSPRIQAMVAQVAQVEFTVTRTEAEALLLESNLIKQHRPRYNVVLRDDKSYPYIYVATEDAFPRMAFHRGPRRRPGRYFGPYPSAGAVRETLSLLQKLFHVRQCEDSFFENRTRPCLQYQIDRCTAPCVGYVDADQYQADVRHAVQFLEGKSEEVIQDLVQRMEVASQRLEFESAARYRDRIQRLRQVSQRQYVSTDQGDVDVVAARIEDGVACVQVFSIRNGLNLGNKSFFPPLPEELDEAGLLARFMGQYYLERNIPGEIVANEEPEDRDLLSQVLSQEKGQAVAIHSRVRGDRARWLELAERNVEQTLRSRRSASTDVGRRLEALQEELDLDAVPARLECFDISHTQGEATVASCVVFDSEGPVKSDYRRFNIRDVEPGDDYGAMREALSRRYARLKKGEGKLPDLLLIDGGQGQVRQAQAVLEELQVVGVRPIGVAKGEGRRPGLERLILSDRDAPVMLPSDSPALHLVQQIRDEAHRFAITGHRQRRSKARQRSTLEDIAGLGPKRRQRLLKHFGGLQGVSRAGVEELAKVDGISRNLAQQIYDVFHSNGP